jgi:PBP1b-binding outer membrane lipoprotein LpoB
MKHLRSLTAALALATLVLAGCSSGGSGQPSANTAGANTADRPSSTGKLTIEAPRNGQTVKGTGLTLKLDLQGAKVVAATTTRIQPDQGHVHVMLDGKLISMNYSLSEKLPKMTVGTHLLQVEFVASDHLPFDPRVLTQAAFQVNG